MQNNIKKIAQNTIYLYIRMFVLMLVTLYTSRVLLSILGVNDFGIYNIIGGIIVLFSFLNSAVTSATQRFLTYSLGKKDIIQFNKIINLSLLTYIILSVIIVLLSETIGLWFLNNKMSIPEDKIYDANIIFHLSIITFIIGLIRTPYNAAIIAHEKMSFYAVISIIEAFLRLLIIYFIEYLPMSNLISYSVLVLIVMAITSSCYIIFSLKKFPECKFKIIWDSSLFRKILGFSSWSVLGSVSTISSNQGVNVLLNIFFGVAVNAAMGISQQISQAINQFITNFQIAFNPQITKAYASDDKEYLVFLIEKTSKLSFYLMTIISVPFILGIDCILKIWLTTIPEYTSIFCILTIISYLIDTLSAPLYMTVQATGKIRNYQFLISIIIFMTIIFSYILFIMGFPPYTAFIVKILISISLLVFRYFYVQKVLNINLYQYLINSVCKPFIIFISIISILSLINIQTDKILYNIFYLLIVTLFNLVIIFMLGLNNEEKINIKNFIIKKIK